MFTALGVLQRDAPSIAPQSKEDLDSSIPLLLIEDFTKELGSLSQEINALCQELAIASSQSPIFDEDIDWERVLASKQKTIERLQNERQNIMKTYQSIMDESIKLDRKNV